MGKHTSFFTSVAGGREWRCELPLLQLKVSSKLNISLKVDGKSYGVVFTFSRQLHWLLTVVTCDYPYSMHSSDSV